MNSLVEGTFALIAGVIKRDELGQVGLCREWVERVLRRLDRMKDKFPIKVEYEAREVKISDSTYHTFIRLSITAESEIQRFIMDGVGTVKLDPYYGPEESAPNHLINSWSDQINEYRKA